MSPVQSETRLSTLALRILTVLEDGEWHDQEEVIDQVQYLIPPGEAFRLGQAISTGKRERDMDDVIASGRRSRTMSIINNLLANGRVEREGEQGRGKPKTLRLTKQVTHIYVVRDDKDDLNVYSPWNPDVVIHIIDQWGRSMDPAADAKRISEIRDTIPFRFPDRDKVRKACNSLISKLNVDQLMRKHDIHAASTNPYSQTEGDNTSDQQL